MALSTLVIVGKPGGQLHRAAHAAAEATGTFQVISLPTKSPEQDIVDAATAVRTARGDVDRSHIVAVLLEAPPPGTTLPERELQDFKTLEPQQQPECRTSDNGDVKEGSSGSEPLPNGNSARTTSANGPDAPALQHPPRTANGTTGPAASTAVDRHLQTAYTLRCTLPHAFICLWHPDAVSDAQLRIAAFAKGCSMVTCYPQDVDELVRKLAAIASSSIASGGDGEAELGARSCACLYCGQEGLSPEGLWLHSPLYHIYDDNRPGMCTVCGTHVGNIAVHVHEAHNPAGPCYEQRRGVGAAVVVHCLRTNRFLMVQEFANQGFWVPGGCTDPGESLRGSALRECLEEAGVEVELKGLVELDYLPGRQGGLPSWRLITFYAHLKDEATARPKTLPCFESAGACWVSAEELASIPLRSPRIPTKWFPYFAAGGEPLPLALTEDMKPLLTDLEF